MAARNTPLLEISSEAEAAIIEAARDQRRVSGLTHNFYRYPARFSPTFARAAIESLSEPGDLILDPFMGGATSLVEALALGRNAIGVDISSLASFIGGAKTTIFDDEELAALRAWKKGLPDAINIHRQSLQFDDYAEAGYYKHLGHPARWRLRKAIEQALGHAIALRSERLQAFGRCVVLRTAQWALDGRKQLPSIDEFRIKLVENAGDMLSGADALRQAVGKLDVTPTARQFHRTAVGLEEEDGLAGAEAPRLVLTSPPYPGVHVLYHRWQVDGRKETPAPFWIAGKLDGAGLSYYTMGDRKYPGLKTYFENIRAAMSSVAALADNDTVIVQMVAFSDPEWQLPHYLETMETAGLIEMFLPSLQNENDGRLWRTVPNRRWHAHRKGQTHSSREVVLFHKKGNGLKSDMRTGSIAKLPLAVSSAT